MANALDALIDRIPDEALRGQIREALKKQNQQKKFGLVFEDHIPESTVLYDVPVKAGSTVALRGGDVSKQMKVLAIDGEVAHCLSLPEKEPVDQPLDSLVSVAKFGEPIYPYLKQLDTVCNAPDSDLWHTLIEADNYHALQLLEYLYAEKVDCIYIDPPYNTGAKDWKYNNDYVDGNDSYRHSKWLSMMEKRLKIAKRLLNPRDSVLIVTIDEKEYLHLGCLLEEMFPDSNIQMVSVVINPSGVSRDADFSRTDEYIFFVKIGEAKPASLPLSDEWRASNKQNSSNAPTWRTLRRRGSNDLRADRPNLFYPIFVEEENGRIVDVGPSLPINTQRESDKSDIPGVSIVWPMKPGNIEGRLQIDQKELKERLKEGYVKAVSKNQYGWIPVYLASGDIQKVKKGVYPLLGRGGSNNEVQLAEEQGNRAFVPGNSWRVSSHNARENGSVLLNTIIGEKRFSYPKSLYAEHDTIRFFVANKPYALIIDFFAGSGTTLHAINLLNAEDGGHRRCIMVTNNEVSADEAKNLSTQGYQPGDAEWERLGIAHYVTWPRTVCSIEGHDVNGQPLKGNYLGGDPEHPLAMADGFKANAAFFHLGFLDKTSVAVGR